MQISKGDDRIVEFANTLDADDRAVYPQELLERIVNLTKNVQEELARRKNAILPATRNEEKRLKIFDDRVRCHRGSEHVVRGVRVDPHVARDEYGLTETAACANDARDTLDEKRFADDEVMEVCSVCCFALGFGSYASECDGRTVGESEMLHDIDFDKRAMFDDFDIRASRVRAACGVTPSDFK